MSDKRKYGIVLTTRDVIQKSPFIKQWGADLSLALFSEGRSVI